MSDQARTEQPSPRRLAKAREEGRFPSSRLFAAGVHGCFVILMMLSAGPQIMQALQVWLGARMREAFTARVTSDELTVLYRQTLHTLFTPWLPTLGLAALAVLLAQLVVTQFGFNWKSLTLDFTRLNPSSRVMELPKRNAMHTLQAAAVLLCSMVLLYLAGKPLWPAMVGLQRSALHSSLAYCWDVVLSAMTKFAILLLCGGVLDLLWTKYQWWNSLKMTKAEVRQETKESEGNLEVKAQLRRMGRQLLRRRMLNQVSTATAIVVNPTHYSVAIRYDLQSMAAPVVVAKGKNLLALQIRRRASSHQIPIVENPPLTRALYRSVEVGQEIPPALYRAVAEILAHILRLSQPQSKR